MFSRPNRSVTLMELIIAIVLLAAVILGINNVNMFSRFHLISSDRRAKLQNDISLSLEHIVKQASKAVGNEAVYGADSAVYITATTLAVLADTDLDAKRNPGTGDYWIRYKLDTGTHRLNYCSQCPDAACATCSVAEEVIASNISTFTCSKNFSIGNYVNVSITACYNAALTCDTPDNPSVAMSNTIILPNISTN